MEEIEVKFLDIDVSSIENTLQKLGAKKQFEKLYKRKVFDFPDLRLDKIGAWVRLRDEGEIVTLTYKQRLGMNTTKAGDKSMEEIELVVSDFEKTALFLGKLGLIEKFYEENERIRYTFEDLVFDIDTWPLIPTYLEIESTSWENIDKAITLLDLSADDKKICSTTQVYKMYGITEKDYQVLTFEKTVLRK